MRVTAVDAVAVGGRSWLHRASPRAKVAAFALVLVAVVASRNVLVVVAAGTALAAVAVSARLPGRIVGPLAAYPAVFALAFAFAAAPDVLTAALFVAKAATAALAAVVLMSSTPYPQVFALVQPAVPEVVGDALLMTYRSLFLLADEFAAVLRAVRLRSGLRAWHPLRSARASVQSLGALVLYALDLAEREYDVMRLRGYERRLRVALPPADSPTVDAALVVGAVAVLAVAAAWRLAWSMLGPYSWLPPLVALACLATAAVMGRRRP
ncbi:MAG: energy-coupling factor transporter transmembrane protein EcfT [Coriobacteriia bacterium]